MMRLNLLILIPFLTIAKPGQCENDTNGPQARVIVSEASSLLDSPLSPVLVYKVIAREETIHTINTVSGRQTSFNVPREAMTPILLKQGICLPCSDGKILLFTLDGTEIIRSQIPDLTILRSLRLSDDKIAILAASFKESIKDFDVTIKVVGMQTDKVTVKTVGHVPGSGKLFSPDSDRVCWVGEKEAKLFSVSEQ